MEAVECGAAAIAMVLAYHGRWVSLDVLRSETGVSRDGSNAASMLKVARAYGLEATGYRKPWDKIDDLKRPAILFWGFNHFVVYEGKRGSTYYLNDPNLGHRTVDEDEFRRNYTGIALQFKPGADFKKGGRRPQLIRPLLKRLMNFKRPVSFLFLVGLLLVIPGVAMPGFLMIFVDQILQDQETRWLVPLLVIMLGIGALAIALRFIERQVLLRLKVAIGVEMVVTFLRHSLNLSVSFHDQRAAGDIVSRVNNNATIAHLLGGQLALSVLNLFRACFFLAVLFFFNVPLTLIALGVLAIDFTAVWLFNRVRSELARSMQQDVGREAGALMAGLGIIDTLKANGQETAFFQAWTGFHTKAANRRQLLSRSTEFMSAGPSFLDRFATQVLVLAMGGLFVMEGTLSIGGLVAYQSLLTVFMTPIGQLVGLAGTLQSIKADLGRVDDVLDCPVDPMSIDPPPMDTSAAAIVGAIQLKDVSYSFQEHGSPAVSNLDLEIQPGTHIAIVGGSDAGKSTTADLIAGLYPPTTGEVLLDGISVKTMPRGLRAATIAKVDAQPVFFEGTVSDNITLWDPTVSIESVRQAAKDACIHDEILQMRSGYSATLTADATNMSGGQRQRLELARALARDPKVLVIDEGTSALDMVNEEQVMANLRKRGCTVIAIAHRLSSIKNSDMLIVLEHGKITERGTHDQLMAENGRYARLVASA